MTWMSSDTFENFAFNGASGHGRHCFSALQQEITKQRSVCRAKLQNSTHAPALCSSLQACSSWNKREVGNHLDSEASRVTHWFIKAGINRRKQVSVQTIGNMNGLSFGELEFVHIFAAMGYPLMVGYCFHRVSFPALGIASHAFDALLCQGRPLHLLILPPVKQ